MNAPSYQQLDSEAMALLTTRLVYHKGSRAALSRELGVSRSGISQALDGKYPGSTANLRSLIIDKLAGQITCPHTAKEISPASCHQLRERPLSAASGSREDVKYWQACQQCRFNPHAKISTAANEGAAS